MIRITCCVVALLGATVWTHADVPAFVSPSGDLPPVLDRVAGDGDLLAIALSPDRSRVIAAFRDPGDKPRSSWLLTATADAEPVAGRTRGVVRDLLWLKESEIYAIVHDPDRRTDGAARLVRIDPSTGGDRSMMSLPPTAADLEPALEPRTLLVAARNEVRVLTLDPLRSGSLYRIVGDNLAIARLAGSATLLVGQVDGLILVALDDPPRESGLPVRDRAALGGPVVDIAPAADGTTGLVRTRDGAVLSYALPPLTVDARGTARALVPDPRDDRPLAIRLPEPPAAPEEPVVADRVPEEVPEPPAAPEEPVVAERVPEEVPEPVPAPRPATIGTHQLAGRVTGPAADRVREVLVLGPDNLLREARRVRPAADGTWGVDGLAPGRYRVQLDAGGGVVLTCRPPFLWIELRDEPVQAPPIEVLRAL